MAKKLKKDAIANLDFRMHPELKQQLDAYGEMHLEKSTESITSALKSYIGFNAPPVKKPAVIPETDKGKSLRLNVRIHERLKEALEEYCKKSGETYTDAITNAVKMYIGCTDSFT